MKPRNRLPAYGLAIFTSFGWQSYAEAAGDSASDSLSEIVVTGVRQAMKDSIATKKNSELIGDNITTAEIGQLPDVTIAEELNRLPGVNTTRDRGNASQASVRGLGPRFVLGLVNGREVASSEPSQDLRWEIYPSEVLGGADVTKIQDAALIPGGIAATIDIKTVSPLDHKGANFSFRAGPTYNDEGKDLPGYNPTGFRASGGYIGRISDDFAVSIAASAQHEKNGFPDFRTFGWIRRVNSGGNTGDLNGDGVPDNTTWGLNTEIKEVTQDRYAIAGGTGLARQRQPDHQGRRSLVPIRDQGESVSDLVWQEHHRQLGERQFLDLQRSGQFLPDSQRIGGGGRTSTERFRTTSRRSPATTRSTRWPLPDSMPSGNRESWRQYRRPFLFGCLAPQSMAGHLSIGPVSAQSGIQRAPDGQVPYGATPGFNPADPALQSAGGFRSNNGSNVNGTGQSDGPEETKDHIAALAVNLSRTLEAIVLRRAEVWRPIF